jgi:hypothetical protein
LKNFSIASDTFIPFTFNCGSIRTIEKNDGILEDVVSGPDLDKPKRRYWIEGSRGVLTQPLY